MIYYQKIYLIFKRRYILTKLLQLSRFIPVQILSRRRMVFGMILILWMMIQNGLLVKEKVLADHDGLIKGNRIVIRKDIETQKENCRCWIIKKPPQYWRTETAFKKIFAVVHTVLQFSLDKRIIAQFPAPAKVYFLYPFCIN